MTKQSFHAPVMIRINRDSQFQNGSGNPNALRKNTDFWHANRQTFFIQESARCGIRAKAIGDAVILLRTSYFKSICKTSQNCKCTYTYHLASPCYEWGHIGQGPEFSTCLYLVSSSPVLLKLLDVLSFFSPQSSSRCCLVCLASLFLPYLLWVKKGKYRNL